MKNKNWLYWAPVMLLCFGAVFSMAAKKVQQHNAEIVQIRHAAESAIRDYLKDRTIKTVDFNSLPIFYNKNKDRGIIGCRALWVDESGAEQATGFGVLLRREKNLWKAAVADIIENAPLPEKKKPGAMDSLFKPAPPANQ